MKQDAAPLTERQRAVLCEMEHLRREVGRSPIGLIAERLRLHHSTAQEHLQALHQKGYLRVPRADSALLRPIPPLPARPPLPIPTRDEDDMRTELSTVTAPGEREPVVVEKRTRAGEARPSSVVVRTRTRTRVMEVVRAGGIDGPITGFRVVEEVEG